MIASSGRILLFSECVYRLLLSCYPAEFRRAFQQEMVQTFRDCCRDAFRRNGTFGVLRLWRSVLYDLVITASAEQVRALVERIKYLFGYDSHSVLLVKEMEGNALVAQFHLNVAQRTDVGRTRPTNEDSMISVIPEDSEVLAKKGVLFVVADGFGGHAVGEVASSMAVNTVNQVYYQDESEDIAGSLVRALQEANAALQRTSSVMGTTCVAVVLKGDTAYIANVGDSRTYILRKGELKQITEDHSWVAQQVRAGLLTEEQARTHEKSNLIYRCLGGDDAEVDTFSEQVQDGDVLILCTDGLTRVVSDEELRSIVGQFGPEESASRLIERANEQGGPDNVTAIVVRVSL